MGACAAVTGSITCAVDFNEAIGDITANKMKHDLSFLRISRLNVLGRDIKLSPDGNEPPAVTYHVVMSQVMFEWASRRSSAPLKPHLQGLSGFHF